ncbi:unnamed protein product [Brugia timori]|uniref:Transposase n=2 Tax=Brugia TaxID=6278 RepID=A0A0R3QZY8_9BILA|nr:unnamed protein product [Brugia timori]
MGKNGCGDDCADTNLIMQEQLDAPVKLTRVERFNERCMNIRKASHTVRRQALQSDADRNYTTSTHQVP